MLNESKEKLAQYLALCCERQGVIIGTNEISKFFEYKDLLISWNKKTNLTAIRDERQIILKHFADSLSIMEFIKDGASVIDIGTGAGFPGLPIRIVNESVKLTLLDSLGKRIVFLREVTDRLCIKDVTIINERAETAAKSDVYREMFDISASRAVAALPVLAEYCLPFVRVGGAFLAMKGGEADEEINAAKSAIKLLGGEINAVKRFSLDENGIGSKRTVIEIIKVKNTPAIYPRKAGIPSKSPLSKNENK